MVTLGKARDTAREHRLFPVWRGARRGEEGMRRVIDHAGRCHENEVHAAGAEIDIAQIEYAHVDIAANDVDGDAYRRSSAPCRGRDSRSNETSVGPLIIGGPPGGTFEDFRLLRAACLHRSSRDRRSLPNAASRRDMRVCHGHAVQLHNRVRGAWACALKSLGFGKTRDQFGEGVQSGPAGCRRRRSWARAPAD